MRSRKPFILSLLMLGMLAGVTCTDNHLVQKDSVDCERPDFSRLDIKPESYPDADIVHLLDEAIVEVEDDGTITTTVHTLFKIMNEKGKAYADAEIGYDSRLETLSLIYARTILSDGSTLPLQKSATNTVTPQKRYPKYSDYKKLTFSMPGVEIGSIVDYKFVRVTKPTVKGRFADSFFFQTLNPILLSRYKILVPENCEISFFPRNPLKDLNSSPLVYREGTKKALLWQYENVPMVIKEPDMPPFGEVAFNVLVTTMPSWDEFFQWWWKEVESKTEPDETIMEKVNQLTANLDTNLAKLQALFDYVKREIRYVSLSIEKSGYVPEAASEVMKNKYGDCKDKSTLLISMLKAAGILSYYVLVPTHGIPDLVSSFPYPFQFNHCIVAVETGENYTFLDPTASTTSFAHLPNPDQGRRAVLMKDGDPVFCKTPLEQSSASGIACLLEIDLNPKGSAKIGLYMEFFGCDEASVRDVFINSNSTETKELLRGLARTVCPQAELTEYELSDPFDFKQRFQVNLKAHTENYCLSAGDLLITPELISVDAPESATKTDRNHPIVRSARSFYKHWMTFTVPEGYEVYSLPGKVELNNQFLEFLSQYESKDGKIVWRVGFLEKAIFIPPSEYKEYSSSYKEIGEANRGHVVFRKKS